MAFASRGGEAVIRTSLFKSGYEMLYAAVPQRERRATKLILDVVVERLGDLLAALLLTMILAVASQNSLLIILAIAAGLGLVGFWISRRLQQGYVQALENSLVSETSSPVAAAPLRPPIAADEFDSQRTVDQLTEDLFDSRFEVRFDSGLALADIQGSYGHIVIDRESVMRAVEYELVTSPGLLLLPRTLDTSRREHDKSDAIEHVFRLLGLVFPRRPMEIAQSALGSRNDYLKGTSLEYLENVLPLQMSRGILQLFEEKHLAREMMN
jgi:hypothetical protein